MFAVVAGQLALLGHVVGGGEAPSLAPLSVVIALVGFMVSGFANKQRSFIGVLGMMTVAQGLFHLGFVASTHADHRMTLDAGRMILFHAVAAVVTSVILSRGERALFGLARALRRVILRMVPAGPVRAGSGWTAIVDVRQWRPVAADLLSSGSRRGPPVAA
ncbi:hypothetical protein D1871_05060 [Nakamurella silvestris]|nr:hypothetical protein D1871_05060 [Nakamurella silvestris]